MMQVNQTLRYLLTQCTNNGKYNYTEYDHGHYCLNKVYEGDKTVIHGPALCTNNRNTPYLSIDRVRCTRCLLWPPQAAAWPTRHRKYGWPDSATVDRIVSNGCDVVGVAHHQCRQHEWMGKCQWRLSFSRAEIVLINSLMALQQVVYHLLRYFIKTEHFLTNYSDNSDADTLNNYHIKILMLWACELKPRSCWTDNLNLVRICVELLHTLSVWLTDTRCPHYFINNCNLLDNSFNVKNMAHKLMSVNKENLSTWVLKNYIVQCALLCPVHILRLFDDVSSSVKLQNAVSEIVQWRLNTSLYDLWLSFFRSDFIITLAVSKCSLTVRSCVYWMNELTKIDKRLSVYFSAVALLHIARKISRNGFSDDNMGILSTVLGNECWNLLPLHNTETNTSEVFELLQKSAVKYLTIYRQLEARDFGSVATIFTTDFEALYAYKRGDYQRRLQLSAQIVHNTLFYAVRMPDILTFPEFIQLLDDDIVSLTALTLIVDPECREDVCISQLTLSLYLMTQCQLKLHHAVMSLAQTLHYIKVTQRRCPPARTLEPLTLKFTERKVFLTTWR